MRRKAVSRLTLTLMLIIVLTFAFDIQPVRSESNSYVPFISGTTQNRPFKTPPASLYPSTVDTIHPEPGQFSDYSQTQYYPNGTVQWHGWWNTSYTSYVQPHVINTTHTFEQPYMNGTYWCTVDTTSRWVTDTSPDFVSWNQTWYFMWIESNVTIGSVINWFTTNATIVGNKILNVAGQVVDTWIARSTLYTGTYLLSYYDKQSGLLVDYEAFYGYLEFRHTLTATNIPIGGKLSTTIYSRLEPNPASIGDTLILAGILVDEFSTPLTNETVKLYARPLAGSWHYITSVATNAYGIFMWQATIPGTAPAGIYIFATYYAGSEMCESTYCLSVLIIR